MLDAVQHVVNHTSCCLIRRKNLDRPIRSLSKVNFWLAWLIWNRFQAMTATSGTIDRPPKVTPKLRQGCIVVAAVIDDLEQALL